MGGGPSSTTSQGTPQIPPYLAIGPGGGPGLLLQGVNEFQNAMTNLPSLTQLFGSVPLQGTAPLNAQQNAAIGGYGNLAGTGGTTPYQDIATGLTGQAAGQMGNIANPQYAQQAFEQFAAPQVEQASVLAGQGTSGAVPYSLAQAAIPYELQDQQTQLAAAQGQMAAGQQYENIGQQQVSNYMNELQGSLQAAGLPQEVQQNILNSAFNQAQQQWGLAKDIQTFPTSLFGPTIGGGNTTVSSGGKF